jgi:hypothetical protein
MWSQSLHLSTGGAVLIALAVMNQSPAQDAPTKAAATTHYRAKQVMGATVNIEGNTSVGKVDDIVFDDNGQIEYMIVLNHGKLVTVPWEAAKFNFEKRTAMIPIAPEKFQQIPTYTVDQYPVFSAPTYRTQTYQYYGLTPGQARRANRLLP